MHNEPSGIVPANDDQVVPPLPPPERIQELLFDAARLGRADMLQALIQAGANSEALDDQGYTPLILACYHGHEEAVEALIEQGANVDQTDGARGNTALMGATFKGFTGITKQLLNAGAAPDAINNAGQTTLMFAALFCRTSIVDLLIARGSDPYRVDCAGNSAVTVATDQGNDLMVARLTAGKNIGPKLIQ